MRARMLFTLITLIAVAALAGSAAARPPFGAHFGGRHGGDQHERFLEKYAERLGVDEETREAIEEAFETSREQAEPLRDELHDAHRTLREMLRAPEPQREEILAQAERIGALDTELRKLRITTLLEVRGMLTPEQREEMISIREERKQEHLQPLMEACAADVDELCPDVEDPRALFGCIRENRDGLSEGCSDALAEMRRGRFLSGGKSGRCSERDEG